MSVLAYCPACGKPYRVANTTEAWICEACDVLLEWEQPAERAERELREGFRCLKHLEWVTTINIVWAAILALAFVGSAAVGATAFEAEEHVRLHGPERLLLAGAGGALLGMAWLARVLILRRPVPVLAAMVVFNLGWAVVLQRRGESWWESVLWALFLGYATWQAARLQRLVRAHPDAFVSRRIRRRSASAAGPGLLTGAGLVAIAVGALQLGEVEGIPRGASDEVRSRYKAADLALEGFRDAWNAGHADHLASLGATGTVRARLAALPDRAAGLPTLTDVTHEVGEDWLRAVYTSAEGEVEVRFEPAGVVDDALVKAEPGQRGPEMKNSEQREEVRPSRIRALLVPAPRLLRRQAEDLQTHAALE